VWVVVADHLEVALEDADVGDVEADEGRVEANIGFGEVRGEEVGVGVLGELGRD
jgi:hypothetical protein